MSKSTRERFQRSQVSLVQSLEDAQLRADTFRRRLEEKVREGAAGGVDADVGWITLVGPIEAEALLGLSRGNRSESSATVDVYARDMVAGKWAHENGNPLVVTASGRLVNGHHRLRAVIRAGVAVRLKISFGNPEEALDVADGHRPRSLGDRFALRGESNSKLLVASVRMLVVLAEGGGTITRKRSLSEMERAIATYKDEIERVRAYFTNKFPASFWGALMFAHPVNPGSVESLAVEVVRGEGASGPAYRIRDYMLSTKSAGGQHQLNVATRTLYAARAQIEHRPLSKFAPKEGSSIIDWFQARRAR